MKPCWPVFKSIVIGIIIAGFCSGVCLAIEIKPYKVALVIGDQWDDPMSSLVTVPGKNDPDKFSISYTSEDFSSLVIMLKSWGVPFEIIRLDQQFLSINHFTGPDGKPEVGCIIWDVNPDAELLPQRYEVLAEAVNNYGISLIGLFDRIQQPADGQILGKKIHRFMDLPR